MGGHQLNGEDERSDVTATAEVFRRGEKLGAYRVSELTLRGARLIGDEPIERGKAVRVQIRLAGVSPIPVTASVKRVEEVDGAQVAVSVEFSNLAPHEVEQLEEVMRTSERRSQIPAPAAVLVFEKRAGLRDLLDEAIRALGRRVLWVQTPLDAIQLLNEPENHIDTVIVDGTVDDPIAVELVEYFSHQTSLRTIVLEGPDEHPSRLERFSAFAHAFLPAQVDRWRLQRVLA